MGTVAYMSPEQVQGMDVDHRSDIWALGCVLYEMVCGQKPFKGVYDKALLYEIVNQQPEPLTGLRTGVPIELEFLTSKCLAKDAGDRYQSAKEITVDLRTLSEKLKSGRSTILQTANLGAGAPVAPTTGQTMYPAGVLPADAVLVGKRRWQVVHGLAALLGAALLGLLFVHVTEAPPEKPVRRFSFSPPGVVGGRISPDGKYIVYFAATGGQTSLWLRSLANESVREMQGTTGVRVGGAFWSPDSEFIGFTTEKEIKKVAVQGGPAITLCALPGPLWAGGTWSPDGETIVFSSGVATGTPVLHEVPARGGAPKLLFEPEKSDKGPANIRPHFLPLGAADGSILFDLGSPTEQEFAVKNLVTGETRLLATGAYPVYSPSGHILYQTSPREPGLWALPFSIKTLEPTGEAFPLDQAGANPSVSQDGTLVYTSAPSAGSRQIAVRDRSGNIVKTVGDPIASGAVPAVSPDGRFVALEVERDIWVYDLDRGIGTRLTSDQGGEWLPAWLSSSHEVSYIIGGSSDGQLAMQIADGSVGAKVLLDSKLRPLGPVDWSSDDRYLVYNSDPGPADKEGGIWYHERGADGALSEAMPYLVTPAAERLARFSPDGRYVAYHSDESGRFEVYVRPFPPAPGKWLVSTGGGDQASWSADGKELFYVEGSTLMVVPVSTAPSFTRGQPQRLFESPDMVHVAGAQRVAYDIFPDGQRFVTVAPVEEEGATPKIRVVENWYEEFRGRQQN
jgi:Tol biopolymer transport system component